MRFNGDVPEGVATRYPTRPPLRTTSRLLRSSSSCTPYRPRREAEPTVLPRFRHDVESTLFASLDEDLRRRAAHPPFDHRAAARIASTASAPVGPVNRRARVSHSDAGATNDSRRSPSGANGAVSQTSAAMPCRPARQPGKQRTADAAVRVIHNEIALPTWGTRSVPTGPQWSDAWQQPPPAHFRYLPMEEQLRGGSGPHITPATATFASGSRLKRPITLPSSGNSTSTETASAWSTSPSSSSVYMDDEYELTYPPREAALPLTRPRQVLKNPETSANASHNTSAVSESSQMQRIKLNTAPLSQPLSERKDQSRGAFFDCDGDEMVVESVARTLGMHSVPHPRRAQASPAPSAMPTRAPVAVPPAFPVTKEEQVQRAAVAMTAPATWADDSATSSLRRPGCPSRPLVGSPALGLPRQRVATGTSSNPAVGTAPQLVNGRRVFTRANPRRPSRNPTDECGPHTASYVLSPDVDLEAHAMAELSALYGCSRNIGRSSSSGPSFKQSSSASAPQRLWIAAGHQVTVPVPFYALTRSSRKCVCCSVNIPDAVSFLDGRPSVGERHSAPAGPARRSTRNSASQRVRNMIDEASRDENSYQYEHALLLEEQRRQQQKGGNRFPSRRYRGEPSFSEDQLEVVEGYWSPYVVHPYSLTHIPIHKATGSPFRTAVGNPENAQQPRGQQQRMPSNAPRDSKRRLNSESESRGGSGSRSMSSSYEDFSRTTSSSGAVPRRCRHVEVDDTSHAARSPQDAPQPAPEWREEHMSPLRLSVPLIAPADSNSASGPGPHPTAAVELFPEALDGQQPGERASSCLPLQPSSASQRLSSAVMPSLKVPHGEEIPPHVAGTAAEIRDVQAAGDAQPSQSVTVAPMAVAVNRLIDLEPRDSSGVEQPMEPAGDIQVVHGAATPTPATADSNAISTLLPLLHATAPTPGDHVSQWSSEGDHPLSQRKSVMQRGFAVREPHIQLNGSGEADEPFVLDGAHSEGGSLFAGASSSCSEPETACALMRARQSTVNPPEPQEAAMPVVYAKPVTAEIADEPASAASTVLPVVMLMDAVPVCDTCSPERRPPITVVRDALDPAEGVGAEAAHSPSVLNLEQSLLHMTVQGSVKSAATAAPVMPPTSATPSMMIDLLIRGQRGLLETMEADRRRDVEEKEADARDQIAIQSRENCLKLRFLSPPQTSAADSIAEAKAPDCLTRHLVAEGAVELASSRGASEVVTDHMVDTVSATVRSLEAYFRQVITEKEETAWTAALFAANDAMKSVWRNAVHVAEAEARSDAPDAGFGQARPTCFDSLTREEALGRQLITNAEADYATQLALVQETSRVQARVHADARELGDKLDAASAQFEEAAYPVDAFEAAHHHALDEDEMRELHQLTDYKAVEALSLVAVAQSGHSPEEVTFPPSPELIAKASAAGVGFAATDCHKSNSFASHSGNELQDEVADMRPQPSPLPAPTPVLDEFPLPEEESTRTNMSGTTPPLRLPPVSPLRLSLRDRTIAVSEFTGQIADYETSPSAQGGLQANEGRVLETISEEVGTSGSSAPLDLSADSGVPSERQGRRRRRVGRTYTARADAIEEDAFEDLRELDGSQSRSRSAAPTTTVVGAAEKPNQEADAAVSEGTTGLVSSSEDEGSLRGGHRRRCRPAGRTHATRATDIEDDLFGEIREPDEAPDDGTQGQHQRSEQGRSPEGDKTRNAAALDIDDAISQGSSNDTPSKPSPDGTWLRRGARASRHRPAGRTHTARADAIEEDAFGEIRELDQSFGGVADGEHAEYLTRTPLPSVARTNSGKSTGPSSAERRGTRAPPWPPDAVEQTEASAEAKGTALYVDASSTVDAADTDDPLGDGFGRDPKHCSSDHKSSLPSSMSSTSNISALQRKESFVKRDSAHYAHLCEHPPLLILRAPLTSEETPAQSPSSKITAVPNDDDSYDTRAFVTPPSTLRGSLAESTNSNLASIDGSFFTPPKSRTSERIASTDRQPSQQEQQQPQHEVGMRTKAVPHTDTIDGTGHDVGLWPSPPALATQSSDKPDQTALTTSTQLLQGKHLPVVSSSGASQGGEKSCADDCSNSTQRSYSSYEEKVKWPRPSDGKDNSGQSEDAEDTVSQSSAKPSPSTTGVAAVAVIRAIIGVDSEDEADQQPRPTTPPFVRAIARYSDSPARNRSPCHGSRTGKGREADCVEVAVAFISTEEAKRVAREEFADPPSSSPDGLCPDVTQTPHVAREYKNEDVAAVSKAGAHAPSQLLVDVSEVSMGSDELLEAPLQACVPIDLLGARSGSSYAGPDENLLRSSLLRAA